MKDTFCDGEGFCLFCGAISSCGPETVSVCRCVIDGEGEGVGAVCDGDVVCVCEFAVVDELGGGGGGGKVGKKKHAKNSGKHTKKPFSCTDAISPNQHILYLLFLFSYYTTIFSKVYGIGNHLNAKAPPKAVRAIPWRPWQVVRQTPSSSSAQYQYASNFSHKALQNVSKTSPL